MAGRPAARLTDMTAHAGPLKPGPGSNNVLIGGLPAWRGLSPAAAAALATAIVQIMKSVTQFTTATSSNNAIAAADALEQLSKDVPKAVQIMAAADQHLCEQPLPVPHGPGVVITGSTTVLINGLPACRQGDTIQETTSVNNIVMGLPTVLIGG